MNIARAISTEYAPADRCPAEEILSCRLQLNNAEATAILDAMPSQVMLINRHRQIVFANKALKATLGLEAAASLMGMRPGEAMSCAFVKFAKGGCGTSKFCSECGAVQAMIEAIDGVPATEEFHLLQEKSTGISGQDLRVTAEPLTLSGQNLVLFTVDDISDRNRRRYLERIFFHDIINTAGGAMGMAEVLFEESGPTEREDLQILMQALIHLVEEIESQRTLLAAENEDLVVHAGSVDCHQMIDRLTRKLGRYREANQKHLVVAEGLPPHTIEADAALLGRVIGNMIKNALEACTADMTITVGYEVEAEQVTFWVHNPTYIPPQAQKQIFRPSFSTKGTDRGLGTFSMRLLTQNYLKGRISFSTSKDSGTTFYAQIPNANSTA
ncbi:ATP-binding protein [Desulfovibrio ferrophilus]|uniref:histidine kinase n=1 Tax=Desulfovibrio ferrophilus TaxID=241368 RepID=A0A2Z6AVL6_9BACT|nr:PAS domain-containing sensor histidine kinase [Desulfovibrio ferrophilus]BBD07260.1 ATP-binding region ATPase domain protein [Desulfovibrio ferrophilus]